MAGATAAAAVLIWIAAAGQLAAADQWDWLCGRALVFLQPAAVFRGQKWQHKAHNWLVELAVHWGGLSATRDFIANCEAQCSWCSLCHVFEEKYSRSFSIIMNLFFLNTFSIVSTTCHHFSSTLPWEMAVYQRRWCAHIWGLCKAGL